MRRFVATALVLYGWGSLIGACHDGRSPGIEASTAYTADHLRCVDKAKTLEESRQCRQLVDERWGITHVVTDGGRP